MDVGQAMSHFGVLFGMTAPLLCLPTALIGAMGLILVPDLARQAALGQISAARRQVERCMTSASTLLFPALAFLAATGRELGSLLFAEASVGEFLLPLAIGTALNCHQSILSNALNGCERQKDSARTTFFCGAIQLLFTLLTVRQWGLSGYIIGYLLSSILGLELNRKAACRVLGLQAQIYCSMIPPAAASVLTGLCCHFLLYELLDRSLSLVPALILCALFGLLLYLCALQAQGYFSKIKTGKG
jgi:O-antigen/teichoic acid export membrane protein